MSDLMIYVEYLDSIRPSVIRNDEDTALAREIDWIEKNVLRLIEDMC